MIDSSKPQFPAARLCLLIASVLLLLVGVWPGAVEGQAPLEDTPDATPHRVYLPLVQHHGCLENGPPLPTLLAPDDDELVAASQPLTFQWTTAVECDDPALHYALQIATDPSFAPGTIVHGVGLRAYGDDDTGTPYYDSSYTLPGGSPGLYYWRVATFVDDTGSGWSTPRRLTALDTPSVQLLANGSFEDTDFAPWQQLAPEISIQLWQDAALAPAGNQFLAAHRQDETVGNKSFYQDAAAPLAGITYHFSIWVHASGEALAANKPRTGRLALWASGDAAGREHSTSNFQLTGTGWHCVETSLTVSQAGHTTLRAEVFLTALDNLEVYFDYAILRRDGRPTCPALPPSQTSPLISTGQGFDTCAAPTTGQLAAWKQASPYEYVGIYLGGANHYTPCRQYNQQHQTPAWFDAVSAQGWRFIPIWVGPQAACTSYSVRMSSNPDQARSEGIAEAQQALAAAANLGLISTAKPSTIIYYDMEYYPTGDAACHQAANAFLSGWVSELQKRGYKAGIYGSVSAVNGWYTLEHVPDSVWVPRYIRNRYDPAISVDDLNQQWITESYWPNHRLFQYSNSHTEVWGGVTLNIDNDTARGLVALDEPAARPAIHDMALLTAGQGWLHLGRRLFRSDSGGAQWRDISPPPQGEIQAVFFLDAAHGWLATSAGNNGAEPVLWQTTTGGDRWQAQPISLPDGQLTTNLVNIEFVTPEIGWLAVELAGSSGVSRGLLLKTEDGGQSWRELALPAGGNIRFVDEEFGWLVSGPTRSELYVTRDGGQSWQPQRLASPGEPGRFVSYDLPVFSSPTEGEIAVTVWQNGTWLERYATANGGRSWQLTNRQQTQRALAFGATLPVAILNGQRWLVASDGLIPGATVTALDFATASTGWAVAVEPGTVPGRQTYRLYRTHDAGVSWVTVDLPRQ